MSDSARDNIFGRLRQASRTGDAPTRDVTVMQRRQWSQADKVDRFSTLLGAVHAEVYRSTAKEWIGKLAALLSHRGVRNLLYAPETALGASLDAAGDALPPRVRYAPAIEDFKAQLFSEVDAAVTTVRAGIAETGTLILWPTVAEPRLMSLVPPLHIAVLNADRLYNTFYEAMTTERWADGMPTNALLISGPSKTADIEQTLAYGVHGPKELIVFLLEETG